MPFIDNTEVIYNTDTTFNSTNKTDNTLNMEWTTDYTKTFANNEDRKLSFAFQVGGDLNDGILKLMKVVLLLLIRMMRKLWRRLFRLTILIQLEKIN